MRSAVVVVLSLLIAPLARAQGTVDYEVDGGASSVVYRLVHKLHEFEGKSKKLQGKARIADGRAQVMVRVPVETFDSGNVNRDAHMKEAVDAVRFPTVEIKALGDGLAPPASFPTKVQKTFKVQLVFHGVQQLFDVPVTIEFVSPSLIRAEASFRLSLDSYKIERPSLMFVKVNDDMKIDAHLVFKK